MKKSLRLFACMLIATLLIGCGKTEGGNETVMAQKEEKKPGNNMKIIYVATNQKTIYESDDLGTYEISYSLDKEGIVNRQNTFMAYKMEGESKESSSETIYIVDYENILQYMDAGMEDDAKLAERYRAFIGKQKNLNENDSITILSIDTNNKICRSIITSVKESWKDICADGSHFDYSYNEVGKKIEYLGFIGGSIRTRTTYEYNAENKMTLLNMHDYITNRETKYELLYDSENRNSEAYYSVIDLDSGTTVRNHTQNMYNENGKLEKSIANDTELTIYKYDEDGKLKKTSSYNSEGTLVSECIYTYEKINMPAESVEFLCHLYDYVGIRYEILE